MNKIKSAIQLLVLVLIPVISQIAFAVEFPDRTPVSTPTPSASPAEAGSHICLTNPNHPNCVYYRPADKQPSNSAGGLTACSLAASELEGAIADCEAKHSSASRTCENVQMTSQMMGMATQAAQAIGSNDQKKLCETSMMLNTAVGSANVGFGLACGRMAGTCLAACKSLSGAFTEAINTCRNEMRGNGDCLNSQNLNCTSNARMSLSEINGIKSKAMGYEEDCGGQKGNSKMAYVQAAMNGITALQSLQCKKMIEAVECKKVADIKARPECYFQLCGPGGKYQGTTECKPIELDCADATNFGAPYCVCKTNPQDPVCPGYNAGGGIGGVGGVDGGSAGGSNGAFGSAADGGFSDEDLSGAIPPDNLDNAINANKNGGAGAGAGMQAGAPFSPGGGFSGNPGGGGKGGAGRGPYNTDILQGPGGGGGGYSGGGGQYPFGSTGADGKSKDGMNLRDFLPGGKRGIAGQKELEKNGLTEANGLSNFQKVTRQVNELRRNKQTIESK